MTRIAPVASAAAVLCLPAIAHAQESNEELAKKLNNPVAGLISVPFQFNYDEGFGPDDGAPLHAQHPAVMPVHITPDWNLIIRTICR
jgi:hypothetical protein